MQTGIAIIDLEGESISQQEREILQHPAVAGIILFSRNYKNIHQLQQLIRDIKTIRSSLFVAVDQEGGRVQRFRDGFIDLPPMCYWGELFEKEPELAKQQLQSAMSALNTQLQKVGVDVNLIPVLDLDHGVSQVIGERSLNRKPEVVVELAQVVIQVLHQLGMPAVGKHFPGHGGVAADSHINLPIDQRDWLELKRVDILPFAQLINQLDAIMPAHIIYAAIDDMPATFSYKLLTALLRKEMGYQGIVISDDLSMAAAATMGSYADRANQALKAGCDLLLVCNNSDGAIEVLGALEGWRHRSEFACKIVKYIRNSF